MRVRAIMTPAKELKVLQPTDSAKDAIQLIEDNGFLSLPVVENKIFVGFLSKQFIYDTFFKSGNNDIQTFLEKPVGEFLFNKVDAVTPDLLIEEAADIFFKNKRRFIPVVGDQNEFLGIVTQNSLFGILTKIYGLHDPKISILTDDFKGVLTKIAETISKNDGNITNIALLDTEVMGIQEISIRLEGKDIDRIVKKLEEKGFKVREFVK
ncbi:CBS domain-containing protein [Fusibacter bizertensis]|jgi:FOG: CBS domain|uniref:CBS domain-containing protein n=1 Tax=Fusibacter bizertensis TaxID=1488331 RepID=A0ABT6NBB4_9FIRM|nr:CBS domain-containing protein [Fusibacter bizertensis]MDH8677713.1 CBS domain-containing protein [Fusibacter bizertensis]